MENPKTPETLTENPSDISLKEAFGASGLFGLTEICTGSVLVSEDAVGEIGGKVGVDDDDDISVNNVAVGRGVVEEWNKVEVVEGENVGVGVDKTAGGDENCANIDGTEMRVLVDNGVGRETQMHAYDTESSFDGRTLLANHEDGEKRIEGAESVQEMGLGLFGNMREEFGVEKIVGDEGMEEDNVMQLNGTDSAAKVKIQNDGISLVVEVCCPPAGVIHGNLDGGNCVESTASKESLVMLDTKNNGHIKEVVASLGQPKQKGKIYNSDNIYSTGDLVWVTTKSEGWWTGQICDPLEAPKYAAKSHETDYLFVRYFGSGNFAWCCPSQLKHFHENFEQMSTQSNSKSFIIALEKAVGEFSRHLKSEMTCSCKLQESLSSLAGQLSGKAKVNKGLSVSRHKSCEYSVSQFEPSWFLAYLKNLAQVGSMPSKLEFAVVHSRLWAYYCSVGHIQMPLHQLQDHDGQIGDKDPRMNEEDSPSKYKKENEDIGNISGGHVDSAEEGNLSSKRALESSKRKRQGTEDGKGRDDAGDFKLASPSKEGAKISRFPKTAEGKVSREGNVDGRTDGKDEKGSESRERKKSKYLSPPYTDLNWGRKGFLESETEDSKISKVSCGEMAVVKCSGKKFQKKRSRKPIDASKYLDVIDTSSAELLSELHMAALNCLYPNENKYFDSIEILFSMFRGSVYHDESDFRISSKNIVGQGEVLEPSEADINASILYVVGNDDKTSSAGLSSPKVITEQKRRKRIGKITAGCPLVIDSQDIDSPAPDVKPQPKQRRKKEGTAPASLPIKGTTAPVPDLNGNGVMPGLLLENSQVMSHVASEGKPEPKKRKRKQGTRLERSKNSSIASAGFANLNVNSLKPISLVVDLHIGPQLNRDGKETATSVGLNTTLCAGIPDVNGSSISQEKGLQGMETATSVSPNSNLGAGLPDVNGSSMSQEKGLLSSEGKPAPKKRKKKEKAMIGCQKSTFGIPDLNGNGAEPVFLGKDSPEVGLQRKKRRKGEGASGTKDPNLRNIKVGTIREALGTTLHLTFASHFPMPSKEVMITTFSKFESLKESETLVLEDSSSAHVVFAANADAVEAVKYLETSNPFGPALVNYRFQHLSASSGGLEPDRNLRIPPIHPVEGVKISSPSEPLNNPVGDAPPLFIVRQNLEIMTSMLEKSGNNLSADMKAKLETDIKSLLKKVSTVSGCSLSSS